MKEGNSGKGMESGRWRREIAGGRVWRLAGGGGK